MDQVRFWLVLAVGYMPIMVWAQNAPSQTAVPDTTGSAPTTSGNSSAFNSFKEAFSAGNQALKEGKFDEAAADYATAENLATSPKGKSQADNAQGWAYYRARKLSEAKKTLLQAVEEDGDNKLALKNLGSVEYDLYQYGMGGLEELKDSIKNLEASGENQEELDRAKSDLTREESFAQSTPVHGAEIRSMNFKPLLALADRLQEEGQFEEALRALKQAESIAVSPKAKGAAANRHGKLLLDARKPIEALEPLLEAVKDQPNEKVFLNNLGWCYWEVYSSGKGKKEDLKKSVDAFYKMNSLDPSYHNENLKMALDELKEVDPEAAKAYTIKDDSDKDSSTTDSDKANDAKDSDSKDDSSPSGDIK